MTSNLFSKKYERIRKLEDKRSKIRLQQRRIANTIKDKQYWRIAVDYINTH